MTCNLSVFHGGDYDDSSLLEFDVIYSCRNLLTYKYGRSILIHISTRQHSQTPEDSYLLRRMPFHIVKCQMAHNSCPLMMNDQIIIRSFLLHKPAL